MKKKRSRTENTISLFPFLSVMACVIGTLTLMIASLALGNLVANHSDERSELYEDVQVVIGKTMDEIAQLRRLIDEAHHLEDQLERAREKLKQVEQMSKQAKRQKKLEAELLAELASLQTLISEMERELNQLNKIIEERRKQLRALEKEMDKAKDNPKIVLQPGGSGQGLKPHFVECTQDSLVIYSDLYNDDTRIEKAHDKDFKKFSDFLKKIKSKTKATVIFLIRPDGVPVYDDVSSMAEKLDVRNGKLPLPGRGEIDFSCFKK